MFLQADVTEWLKRKELPIVDLVFGSPPYAEKGERYGFGGKWPTRRWVQWMADITEGCVVVSRGYVVWVVNGAMKDGCYQPACEGLVWILYQRGIICERPVIWWKNSIAFRNDWFKNEWEYVLAFKPKDRKCHFNWESVAVPPKYKSGGRFRQRTATGERKLGSEYPTNPLAHPSDIVRVTVGGGHMGHRLAHCNEAPFPLKLAEFFVKTCSKEGDTVLDPFCGSGTTAHACYNLNRKWIGLDVRQSQIELSERRMKDVCANDCTTGEPKASE